MSAREASVGGEVVRLPTAVAARIERAPWVASVAIGGALFAIAYENGGYGLTARSLVAVCVWVLLVVAAGLAVIPRESVPAPAVRGALALGAFAAWTFASAFWAPSAESAFTEFDRITLYLGVFVVAVVTSRPRGVAAWLAGLALGIDAIVLVSLVSRFFPSLTSNRDLATFLPNASTRLTFPLGYWNGLAVLAALALPLGACAALTARSRIVRAAAPAAFPPVAAVIVLTSSRGGALAALVGLAVFFTAAARRMEAARVLAVGLLGAAASVAVLRAEPRIVDGPLGTPAAAHAGHAVALMLVLVCVATAAGAFVAEQRLAGLAGPSPRTARALLLGAAVIVVAAVVAAHPVRRFHDLQQLPAAGNAQDFASAHLTSGSGSGRWQFWTAALHEWESAPVVGRGAGSYQSWWAQHASFTYFLKNAHSLYLEVLGETGVVGLLLLLAAIVVPLVAGVRRVGETEGVERTRLASVLGVALAFFVTAGIDWTWQLTAVALVGIVALGLAAASPPDPPPPARRAPSRLGMIAASLVVAWAILIAQAIPWLASRRIGDSQAAAARGNLAAARKDALDAKTIEPWASSPYLQLALVDEARRDYASAQRRIRQAESRATTDWSIWYVAARIEREAGDPQAAAAAYARARGLNPRSPVFTPGSGNP